MSEKEKVEGKEQQVKEEQGKHEEKKKDIKALVAVIPPATQLLRRKEKKLAEKRIRVRRNPSVKPEHAYINPQLAKELGIKDYLEIVIARRHRYAFKAILDEKVPVNEVWCNEDLLREDGVADNSIATVRRIEKPPKLGRLEEKRRVEEEEEELG